jgi:hypothetical protein
MLANRPGTRYLLLFSALAAAVSCNDRTQVTNPLTAGYGNRSTAAPSQGGKVKIKTLQLSSNTLSIEGPAVSGNVDIGNSGTPIDSVSIRGLIVQGSASREASAKTNVNCAGTPATLPNGTCPMTFSASASNSGNGTGTLVPGAAVFELDVIQTVAGTETVLASKTLSVTLVAPATISNLVLNSTTLAIDGPSIGWTATLSNPGLILKGVFMQGEIIQGTTVKGAGGATITCGAALGVLPPGTCTFSFTVTASNSAGGTGALTPGAATFQLQLLQSDGTTTTVLDTKTIAVTLVPDHPVITSVVANPQIFAIDGPSTTATVVLYNPTGAAASGLRLAETITQNTTQRAAGGASVSCGAGDGVLPVGSCTMTLSASASNSSAGTGTLIGQLAYLQEALIQNTGGGDQVLDTLSYAVGLLPPPTPKINSVKLNTTTVILDGPAVVDTIVLGNQNVNSFSGVNVSLSIVQGATTVGVGGGQVSCGAGAGVLPTGTCTVTGNFTASSSGTGLVAGAARLQVKLFQFPTFTTYDTTSIAITIVPNALSITNLQLQSDTITIGGSTGYSVTVYNPTNANISIALVQGEMLQGATDRAAGGTDVICGQGSGVLPPGFCTFQFIAVASNSTGGTGTLVPGAATFQLTLLVFDGTTNTTYDVKDVAVTLVNP